TENGFIKNISAWVIDGLGCITADLPQGNDLASVKKYHEANHGNLSKNSESTGEPTC
ncbi:15539_t:CDS:2, partial [Gigaspora rosea]